MIYIQYHNKEVITHNCIFCQRQFTNPGALGKHTKTCRSNPDRVEKCGGKNKGAAGWNKGLTAATDPRVKKGSEKFLESISNGSYIPHSTPHTDQWKKEQSERKIKLYESGWEPVCGRAKKYDYTSPVAGVIKVDGTWELAVAKHLDNIGVIWKRNKKRFLYIKPDGKQSSYQPDFYVEDWNSFLEVKGYETELDRAKWAQFTEKLIIWKWKDIESFYGK